MDDETGVESGCESSCMMSGGSSRMRSAVLGSTFKGSRLGEDEGSKLSMVDSRSGGNIEQAREFLTGVDVVS